MMNSTETRVNLGGQKCCTCPGKIYRTTMVIVLWTEREDRLRRVGLQSTW